MPSEVHLLKTSGALLGQVDSGEADELCMNSACHTTPTTDLELIDKNCWLP